MIGSPPRSARRGRELFRRQRAGDDTVLDDLVAPGLVNHAAGPQGREGLRDILRTIEVDLGPTELEQHHFIGEGDLVAQHVTLHGRHRASTMPLLADTHVSGRYPGAQRRRGYARDSKLFGNPLPLSREILAQIHEGSRMTKPGAHLERPAMAG